MAVDPFINFNGNCKEAVLFYAKVFDCPPPRFMTFGEMPPNPDFPPLSESQKDLIMYATLPISGNNIMFSDISPSMTLVVGNNINLTVGNTDKEKIKTWFNRLKEDGAVHMELQQTFWSECYGMLVDKYGIPWQLSYDNGTLF